MPATAEETAVTAPAAETSAPTERDTLRPRAWARRASGTAAAAAPRVLMVAAIPDQAGEPDRAAASSAPRESVAPMPIPPRICPATRTASTRRWDRCAGAWEPVAGVLG
ncbi:hypothetical protein AO716_13460 [Arthrobacter sp. Edens01]|nr:hypothetical protein AO716_13460 [Arthrobacter sp. Edens01]